MNKRLLIVTAFLLATVGLRAWVSVAPKIPERKPLQTLPQEFGEYRAIASSSISDDVQQVLKADDYVVRRYADPRNRVVDLFIAYYQVQHAGESMHSPKNCLPGSGWAPLLNDVVPLSQTSDGKTVKVNRYIVEREGDRALVLYWYQANGRVIASEYWGKFFLVYDALRSGRRDGSIVRLVIPLNKNDNPQTITDNALTFARSLEQQLPNYLPN